MGGSDMYRPAPVVKPFGRPLPEDIYDRGEFFFVKRQDGVRLRGLWVGSVKDESRGSLIIHPGRTEFIEKYLETIEDFLARGFTVLAFDPRGQGLSTRQQFDPLKSHTRNFQDYAEDLAFLIDELGPHLPRPHILLGHSVGGCVALQSILIGGTSPSAIVCTAPTLGLFDIQSPMAEWFIRICTMIGFSRRGLPFQGRKRGLPVPFKGNKLTSDKARFRRWAEYLESTPELRMTGPTFSWVSETLGAMAYVNRNARRLNVPGLIVAAGGDPIVDPASNKYFAERAGLDFRTIPGALHEVLMERDAYRDMFFKFFDAFLKTQAL